MFCPKCGTQIKKEAQFCPNCGNKIQVSTTDQILNKSQNVTKKIINGCKKYKKPISFVLLGCFLISLSIILFNTFYDFTKISWDLENGDAKISRTSSRTLTLNVLAYDKENKPIANINFSADNGSLVADGNQVKWTLPAASGNYTIIATTPSGKKIKKTIQLINLENEERNNLAGIVSENNDDTFDSDNDGLTDAEEKKLTTNIYSADTDGDGLLDKYEIDISHTDPLLNDTDGDGLLDGDELALSLDALKTISKEDGIIDSERNLTFNMTDENLGVTLVINGKGNIASSTVDLIKNSALTEEIGLLDKIYNFYTKGNLDNAQVTIKYDLNEINKKGLNEDNLTLYYFNEITKKLEKVPTTIDKNNQTISSTLNHFSKYVIGDSTAVLADVVSQIMFVIDNSVSMYSENQMIAAGYNASQGAVGNDIEFKRLSLTNKMIDMFTGNYEFGVAEFSGNYVNLTKFTNDIAVAKNAVDSMKNNWNSNANGTNIIDSLNKGIAEFKKDKNNHYLILLTDGKNTDGVLSSKKNTIVQNAQDKDLKICVIGLGNDIDEDDLDFIAENTGCDYYNAFDASALDEIYSLIGANINFNLVDTEKDNKVDGMINANSGFIVTRDGFSFKNFISNKSDGGHCYGMATFAMLYYTKNLPLALKPAHKWTIFKNFAESGGYDLTDTFIEKNENLYDYKITNEALNLLLSNTPPSDYRDRVENETWMIKKEYYDKLKNIGATFSNKKYKGEDFNSYQSALLNIDTEEFNKAVVKDESQLLNAIYRLFILQIDDKNISFSTTPDKAFQELENKLTNGTPVVLAINNNHAINAIKLIQDINDANKFKIEVYDNNYPGESRYINVSRSKSNKLTLDYTAWTNEYSYTFTYDTNNDGVSEELPVSIREPIIE